MNLDLGRYNAITARRLATRRSSARSRRRVADARYRVTAIDSARRESQSVFFAEDHMNRSVETAAYATCTVMTKNMRVFQLNTQKRDTVLLSVMNDDNLNDFTILAISEPFARKIGGAVMTAPNIHSNWTKMTPTLTHDTQWPIRSMLWI